MTPKNISDPGPGEVMTLEIFFDLDPSGVMTPEIFLNPTLAGSTAGLTAAGSNWGRPRMIPTREDPEFSLTISLIFCKVFPESGLDPAGSRPRQKVLTLTPAGSWPRKIFLEPGIYFWHRLRRGNEPRKYFWPRPRRPRRGYDTGFFLPRPQRGHDPGNVFWPQTGVTIPAGSFRGRPRLIPTPGRRC